MTTTASSNVAQTMRASTVTKYGSNFAEVIQYREDFPTPRKEDLKDNQVLVQIKFAAINPVDYKAVEGKLKAIVSLPKFPTVMGKDFSGVVVATGKRVTRVKEGDEVFGMASDMKFGSFAEYGVFEEKELAVKSKSFGWEQAAAAGVCYITSFQALLTYPTLAALWNDKASADDNIKTFSKEKLDQVTKDLQVLIHGASGGTGSYMVLLAKHFFKFGTVYGTCSTKNVEYVKSLGADVVIDYTKQKVESVITTKIDLVIDTVASEDTTNSSFAVLKESGKNGTYSSITAPETVEGGLLNMLGFGASIGWKMLKGKTGYGPNTNMVMAKASPVQLEILSKWVESDPNVQKLISLIPITTFDLAEASNAFEKSRSHRTVGKNVIVVSK